MKTRRKLLMGLAMLGTAGACLWTTTDAHAGRKYNTEVTVWSPSSTTRAAQGAIGAARNSTDSVQAIGCHLVSSNGGAVQGGCYAYNASNQYAGCSTTDWDLLEVIKAMSPSAYVQFYARSDGSCETIRSYNDSYEPPKLP